MLFLIPAVCQMLFLIPAVFSKLPYTMHAWALDSQYNYCWAVKIRKTSLNLMSQSRRAFQIAKWEFNVALQLLWWNLSLPVKTLTCVVILLFDLSLTICWFWLTAKYDLHLLSPSNIIISSASYSKFKFIFSKTLQQTCNTNKAQVINTTDSAAQNWCWIYLVNLFTCCMSSLQEDSWLSASSSFLLFSTWKVSSWLQCCIRVFASDFILLM